MDTGSTIILAVMLILILFCQVAAFRFSEKMSILNDRLDTILDELKKNKSN